MKNLKKVLLLFSLMFTMMFVVNGSQSEASSQMISGPNRIDTAIAISKQRKSNTVIVINNMGFADGISAVNLAKKENSSILLNPTDVLDSRNIQEIQRIAPSKIFIVGSNSLISSSVESKLRSYAPVTRFQGADRYATNKAVLDYVFPNRNVVTQSVVANGTSFSDLISISAYAYQNNYPLVLSDKDGLNLPYMYYPNSSKTIVIGGTGALTDAVTNKVRNPQRIFGDNRYDTSANIQSTLFSSYNKLFVATGEDFPDSLTGVTLVNKGDNIQLLRRSVHELSNVTNRTIIRLGDRIQHGNGIAIYVNPHQDDEVLGMGLKLVKDKNSGKEIYIMQMTDGSASNSYTEVNRRLSSQGWSTITKKQFSDARDLEVLDVLSRLGIYSPNDAFIKHLYVDNTLTASQVTTNLKSFISGFKSGNIEIRTYSRDDNDFSKRNRIYQHNDHAAVANGVAAYMTQRDPKVTSVRYMLGTLDTGYKSGYTEVNATYSEGNMWKDLMNAYKVWNPSRSRYSVGYISVPNSFNTKAVNLNIYERNYK